MANYDRQELKDELERQAAWRRQKAHEFPNDARNLMAAEKLDHLAKSLDQCSGDIITAFLECFEDESTGSHSVERWSEMLRQVGFSTSPDSAEELLNEFIAEDTGAA